jgi:hypothetical protein
VPLFDEKSRAEWPDSPHWIVEGELDGRLVVSVPVTTSIERIRNIHDQLEVEFNKPVCVITHNMEFLVAKKLPPKEAAEVIKRIEDYAEERTRTFQEKAKAIDDESETTSGTSDGIDSVEEKGMVH